MPNILKHFFRPQVGSYTFPPADEIQVEEEKTDQPEEERLPDEGDHAEESGQDSERPGPDPGQGAAAMFSYAKVQSETIIAQAKSEGEALLEEYRRQAMEEAQQLREEAKLPLHRHAVRGFLICWRESGRVGGASALATVRARRFQCVLVAVVADLQEHLGYK